MCGCRSGAKSGAPAVWTVRLPDGTISSYSSEIAAKAKVKAVAGATLTPPAGVEPTFVPA